MIRTGRAAGVVLFAGNLPSRAAGRRLIGSLQAIPRPPGLRDPLLVMTDQEGGLVKRIGGAPSASARTMGARGPAFSREQGRRTAANLRDLGINVDLAPVLDVARPGGTIAAADRSFGSTAAAVAATAVPFAEAMQGGGVAATGKHFPGLGSAELNTDLAVQRIGLSKQALRSVDEAPYSPFIAAGGVTQANAEDFIRAGATALGIGKDLIPQDAIQHRQGHRINELAHRYLGMIKAARTPYE